MTAPTTPHLLPCPFCSKSVARVSTASEMFPELDDEGNYESYTVICDASTPGAGGCGASGGFCPEMTSAITLWNIRIGLPAPVDLIADADKMVSQWVSVDERLPNPDVFVLAVMRSKRKGGTSCVVAAIEPSDGMWFLLGGSDVEGLITHYQPLPAPPVEQGARP